MAASEDAQQQSTSGSEGSLAVNSKPTPTLDLEGDLFARGARLVAGMDEVGRGALAGPVAVGVAVVCPTTVDGPAGLADSKLLTAARRQALVPALRDWPLAAAVGYASAAEIDAVGITAALRLAGQRALAQVEAVCGPVDVVILDGKHDWLTPPVDDLLADVLPSPADDAGSAGGRDARPADGAAGPDARPAGPSAVVMRVKADQTCASVAAASVLAKVDRDQLMTDLAAQHPQYGWEGNKGYGAATHVAAIRDHGLTDQHRQSWTIKGV